MNLTTTTSPTQSSISIEGIREKLERIFQPTLLEIEDDSARHAGHAGKMERPDVNISHLHISIVSEAFRDLSHIARHRLVYEALSDEFALGLHALALTCKTPDKA